MKNKKHIFVSALLIASPFLLAIIIYLMLPIFNPIMRSNEKVQTYVEKSIPIGTSWDDALTEINVHYNWYLIHEYPNTGVVKGKNSTQVRFPFKSDVDNPNVEHIGSKTIEAHLGQYYRPWHTDVRAFLVFDNDDKLIYVSITKDLDSI